VKATTAVVTLKPAATTDCREVWLWRNDDETRRASFDSSEISLETHERWFLNSLQMGDRHMYIVLADGQPAGVVRLDVRKRQATVSIHLARERRGQGLGPAALLALDTPAWGELGLDFLFSAFKPENYSSISAFKKAGFSEAPYTGPAVTLTKLRPESKS